MRSSPRPTARPPRPKPRRRRRPELRLAALAILAIACAAGPPPAAVPREATTPVGAPSGVRPAPLEWLGAATLPRGTSFQGTLVGGLSGLVWDGEGDTFYALSDDRGEHAQARFYRLRIDLSDGRLADGDVTVTGVTFLSDRDHRAYPSRTIDPEGFSRDARGTFYFASEGVADDGIAPFVAALRADGSEARRFPLPPRYTPDGHEHHGVRDNLAFESLTVTPDQRYLVGALENALTTDGPAADVSVPSLSRILVWRLGACATETRSRAQGSYGVNPRREEEAMRGHRRRRATPETPRNPLAPFGLRWRMGRLLRCRSSTMARHRLRRRASYPAPRRAQRDCAFLPRRLLPGGGPREYAYRVEPVEVSSPSIPGLRMNGLSDLLALSDRRFLALERQYVFGAGPSVRLYRVSLDGATDVSYLDDLSHRRLRPAAKELLADFAELGVPPENYEGMALGPRLPDGRRVLVVVSDDNFDPLLQRTRFLAFAVSPSTRPCGSWPRASPSP